MRNDKSAKNVSTEKKQYQRPAIRKRQRLIEVTEGVEQSLPT